MTKVPDDSGEVTMEFDSSNVSLIIINNMCQLQRSKILTHTVNAQELTVASGNNLVNLVPALFPSLSKTLRTGKNTLNTVTALLEALWEICVKHELHVAG